MSTKEGGAGFLFFRFSSSQTISAHPHSWLTDGAFQRSFFYHAVKVFLLSKINPEARSNLINWLGQFGMVSSG
jgi:hypothetical protein